MRIKLANVGVINKCDLEFIPGFNLIIGSSGSGKSTLMRCIYNIVMNSFSDADIMFGKNKLSAVIENNGNIIEYCRGLRTKGEPTYYKINNEKYTKLGRLPLPAVNDVLKIGDIQINGEDINFNFNLQFAAPFLILGSQSTLYNVLTYRNTFDITLINDYYSTDIKTNNSEITATNAVKDKLTSNLELLKAKKDKLAPVEDIYSAYITYKHNKEFFDELVKLKCNLEKQQIINKQLQNFNKLINNISEQLSTCSIINDLNKYAQLVINHIKVCDTIDKQKDIIYKYNNIKPIVDNLNDLELLLKHYKTHYFVNSYISDVENIIHKIQNTFSTENILYDLLKLKSNINVVKQYEKITDIETTNKLQQNIEQLFCLLDKFNDLQIVNNKILKTNNVLTTLCAELSEFKVCPLCGNHLDL